MNGQATTSPGTLHAAQGVTVVVLTVGLDDARIRRSVAIQGMPPKGAPSPDGVAEGILTTTSRCAGHTITYGFAADRPGTITYHARYGYSFDRPSPSLVGVQGSEAGGRARTDAGHGVVDVPRRDKLGSAAGGRARTDAGHGVVDVPQRDKLGSAAGGRARTDARHGPVNSRAGRPAGIAVPLLRRPADGSRGVACVEAQLMADCPVIYYNAKEYGGGGPPLQRLLRWSAAALAAICGLRDPDVRRRCEGPLNVRFAGRANPHVLRAPYFSPP